MYSTYPLLSWEENVRDRTEGSPGYTWLGYTLCFDKGGNCSSKEKESGRLFIFSINRLYKQLRHAQMELFI